MYSILPNCFLVIIYSLIILNHFLCVCFKTSVFKNHCNLCAQYLMLHYHIKQGTNVKSITEEDGLLLLLNSLNH